MANLDATHTVLVGGGNCFTAPIGTTFPTAMAAPGAPWVNLGYLTEEGPRPTGFERTTEKFYSWNTDTPIRSRVEDAEPQIEMDLMQVEEESVRYYFGGGAFTAGTPGDATDPAVLLAPTTYSPIESALCVDWFDGTSTYRLLVPRALVVANGDMTLGRGEMLELPIRAEILTPAGGGVPFELRWSRA